MVARELPFSAGTAQRLVSVASDTRISNAAHGPFLPASWRSPLAGVLPAFPPVRPGHTGRFFRDSALIRSGYMVATQVPETKKASVSAGLTL